MTGFDIHWVDCYREPKCRPNGDYPNGIDVDMSRGQIPACTAELPYPAKRCGFYMVSCRYCGACVGVTTAGRPDDPRSVKVACLVEPSKKRHETDTK